MILGLLSQSLICLIGGECVPHVLPMLISFGGIVGVLIVTRPVAVKISTLLPLEGEGRDASLLYLDPLAHVPSVHLTIVGSARP